MVKLNEGAHPTRGGDFQAVARSRPKSASGKVWLRSRQHRLSRTSHFRQLSAALGGEVGNNSGPSSTHRAPQLACSLRTLLLLPKVRAALQFYCPTPQLAAEEGCSVAMGRQIRGGISGTRATAVSVSRIAAAKRIQAFYPHDGLEPQGDGSGAEPTS